MSRKKTKDDYLTLNNNINNYSSFNNLYELSSSRNSLATLCEENGAFETAKLLHESVF